MSAPHGKHLPFPEVEASREPFDVEARYKTTQIVNPAWSVPQGLESTDKHPRAADFDPKTAKFKELIADELDGGTNYKLLM